MQVAMLTTFDNPYDPFDQWEEWYAFDEARGYSTSGLLARIAIVSNELSDSDVVRITNQAIEAIVSENVSGMHRQVIREI
jgi:hypothetical protein